MPDAEARLCSSKFGAFFNHNSLMIYFSEVSEFSLFTNTSGGSRSDLFLKIKFSSSHWGSLFLVVTVHYNHLVDFRQFFN